MSTETNGKLIMEVLQRLTRVEEKVASLEQIRKMVTEIHTGWEVAKQVTRKTARAQATGISAAIVGAIEIARWLLIR